MRVRAQSLMRAYATMTMDDRVAREALYARMFGSVGRDVGIAAPVYLDYGVHTHILDYGVHTHIGDDVYLNFGVVLLDVCEIRIGRPHPDRPARAASGRRPPPRRRRARRGA